MNVNDLNHDQLDFFRELENIGAGHAATALSTMLNQTVNIKVPRAQICEFNQICDFLNGPEALIIAQLVEISGDLSGFILMVQSEEDAQYLSGLLLGGDGGNPDENGNYSEMQISALQEIANILTGSYITAISGLTGFTINCSIPKMVIDMAGAVMNLPATAYGAYGDKVLFLETEYHDENRSITGHFFLIPDIDSYQNLLCKMGIA